MTLKKRFKKEFAGGMEFWTSEDGTLLSIAICYSANWMETLAGCIKARNPRKRFKMSRIKERYAYREWAEPEYFFFVGQRGKIWRVGDKRTPFRVYEYELETPV